MHNAVDLVRALLGCFTIYVVVYWPVSNDQGVNRVNIKHVS